MKHLRYFVIGLCIMIFILVTIVENYTFSLSFYESEFDKYDIYANTDLDKEGVRIAATGIIDYLRNDRADLAVEYGGEMIFNEREISHMVDVKSIFTVLRYMKNFSVLLAILLLLTSRKMKTLFMGIIYSGINSMILLGVLIVLMLTDFTGAFIKFHHMFFNNDLWILDPRTDRLIQMLPEGFFFDMAAMIVITHLAIILTIVVIALVNKKRILTKS